MNVADIRYLFDFDRRPTGRTTARDRSPGDLDMVDFAEERAKAG